MIEMSTAAVHEAGHLVVAYLVGFCPESVRITTDGDGQLRIDYGELDGVARQMMAMDICPEFSTFLRQLNKDAVVDLARRLCVVLVAGGIAEAISRDGPDFCGKTEVELSGPDLTRAETISKHFGIDLNQEIMDMYGCLGYTQAWITIEALKEAILSNSANRLDRLAIDVTLESSGFKAFLEQE